MRFCFALGPVPRLCLKPSFDIEKADLGARSAGCRFPSGPAHPNRFRNPAARPQRQQTHRSSESVESSTEGRVHMFDHPFCTIRPFPHNMGQRLNIRRSLTVLADHYLCVSFFSIRSGRSRHSCERCCLSSACPCLGLALLLPASESTQVLSARRWVCTSLARGRFLVSLTCRACRIVVRRSRGLHFDTWLLGGNLSAADARVQVRASQEGRQGLRVSGAQGLKAQSGAQNSRFVRPRLAGRVCPFGVSDLVGLANWEGARNGLACCPCSPVRIMALRNSSSIHNVAKTLRPLQSSYSPIRRRAWFPRCSFGSCWDPHEAERTM